MKQIPCSEDSNKVSFVDDPEAIACLLEELMHVARESERVRFKSIYDVAVSLGYRGDSLPLQCVLIENGYVCELEEGVDFRITAENQYRIDEFFKRNARLLGSSLLSKTERISCLATDGGEGTPVDQVYTRIIHLFSKLMTELSSLSQLSAILQTHIAEREVAQYVAMERVQMFEERFERYREQLLDLCEKKRGTLHFRKVLERYQIAFVRLDDALDEAIRSNDELESYVDDMAKVEYLAQFSPTLMKLFMFFLENEDKE